VKRRISDVTPICLFAFYGNNAVVASPSSETTEPVFLYFFVVYTVEDEGVEREVGKVVAPVGLVDEVLDGWREVNHPTMGTRSVRDISWSLLFNRLAVSQERLVREDAVDLTSLMSGDSGEDM
jgi:hypothetical protein